MHLFLRQVHRFLEQPLPQIYLSMEQAGALSVGSNILCEWGIIKNIIYFEDFYISTKKYNNMTLRKPHFQDEIVLNMSLILLSYNCFWKKNTPQVKILI